MKRIYDFARKPASRNYTIDDLRALKGSGKRLTMCNPANPTEIQACVDAGIDVLTCWDDQVEIAREIAPTHFIGTGTTWRQYHSTDEILSAAIRSLEQGADMFYTLRSLDVVEVLAREGIPVQGHLGLIPTYSIWNGGLRAFGRTADEAMELYREMKRFEDAGGFAMEVECVAEEALNMINDKTNVVTFSLGSGNAGDAIFLFMADICGENSEEAKPPKHAHAFGNLKPLHDQMYRERVEALKAFQSEVTSKAFPYPANAITMRDGEADKLAEALDKR